MNKSVGLLISVILLVGSTGCHDAAKDFSACGVESEQGDKLFRDMRFIECMKKRGWVKKDTQAPVRNQDNWVKGSN